MKKTTLFLFLALFFCTNAHATNLFAKAAGGNWSAAGTWSTTSSAGADNSGPPTNANDVIFDSGSTGTVTVNTTTCVAKTVTCQGSGNKIAFTSGQNLTVSGSVTFFSGMTLSGTGKLTMNTTGTLTTGGLTIPGGLAFTGTSQSYTLADNLTVTGLLTLAGTTAQTIAAGSHNMVFNGGVTETTGPATFTGAGTVSAASLSTNSSVLTISSDWTISGLWALGGGSSPSVIVGAHNMSCDSLRPSSELSAVSTGGITFPASQTLTVATTLGPIVADSNGSISFTIKSGTSSTAMNFTYQGTLANENLYHITFTDVDASTSTNHVYNYQGSTLTRTTNIYNIDPSNFPTVDKVVSGTSYAGGALTGTASAGSFTGFVTQ